jgi:chemotaxis protein histidine kinase CheA/ActR/RegA family two-component response regulator
MQTEQQKRILGYFIEEAREHLETIEHSLLNLQAVVEDTEMMNEVFRAAHSVKGGAAMLGIYSIQQTAHKLEDYFKILKEHPIRVDQKLEALFFQGLDTLSELLEELQSPFGLADEVADKALRQVEPVFVELQQHLTQLVEQGEGKVELEFEAPGPELTPAVSTRDPLLLMTFENNIPQQLRELLRLFKQGETLQHRRELLNRCQNLADVGKQFGLAAWSNLLETTLKAVSAPQNSFAELAPLVIKELKAAQEFVLADRAQEIQPSSQLLSLLPVTRSVTQSVTEAPQLQEQNLVDLFGATSSEDAFASLFDQPQSVTEVSRVTPAPDQAHELAAFFDDLTPTEPANLQDSSSEEDLSAILGTWINPDSLPVASNEVLEPQSPNVPVPDSFGDIFADLLNSELVTDAAESRREELVQPLANLPDPVPAQVSFADQFESLDALLQDDDFEDLERLVEDNRKPAQFAAASARLRPARRTVSSGFEQTMKVSVKHLDSLSNLVGEMVVNRNSLEDSQERLRQFLENLLYQVQQLGDVGQQMQDLYERSLLESSLLAIPSRSMAKSNASNAPIGGRHATGANFDALEMDRFTGFHSLSQEVIERIVRIREAASDIEFVVDETEQVTRMFRQVTTQVQEGLSRSRMMPFAQIADRLPRAVRDLSLKCGKEASLEIEGRDTLVDKGILERLYDPLTHLVNNAIYHGIESPSTRQSLGKPAQGMIKIRALYQGSQIVISISDDGAGIDPEKVKAKAIRDQLITPGEAAAMSRQDVYTLLFKSGFSTQEKADDLAGRGVGMDVVRASLDEIHGLITTDSTPGKGTTFTIRLPLTLSIAKALCCIDKHCRIAFPIDGVEDMVDVSEDRLITNESGTFLTWRDRQLSFHHLSELLPYQRLISRSSIYGEAPEDDVLSVVILRSADDLIAIQVDQVLGEQEIVIKQLGGPVPKPVGITGVTVQGDGRVMPIADILELVDLALGRLEVNRSMWGTIQPTEVVERTDPLVLIVDDSITVREILSMTFNKVGYRVEQARDGQEAWEKLRSGLPCDLIFCDIEMPRMDGLELLSRLQKDPDLRHLPIAMLTSRGADRHRQMAVQLGAKAYFTKPYLEESLLDAASRMLKGEVLVSAIP